MANRLIFGIVERAYILHYGVGNRTQQPLRKEPAMSQPQHPRTERPRPRLLAACLVFFAVAIPLLAQEPVRLLEVRYRVEFNLERFPQKSSEEALKSVIKAIAEKKYDYLLAQLALPSQVDARVLKRAETFPKGSLEDRKFLAFEDLIRTSADYFLKDPVLFQELSQFADKGDWKDEEEKKDEKGEVLVPPRRIVTHKKLPGRSAIFHKLEDRWFLENRQR